MTAASGHGHQGSAVLKSQTTARSATATSEAQGKALAFHHMLPPHLTAEKMKSKWWHQPASWLGKGKGIDGYN